MRKTTSPSTSLTARLPLELWADVRRIAKARRQSVSELTRDALERVVVAEFDDADVDQAQRARERALLQGRRADEAERRRSMKRAFRGL